MSHPNPGLDRRAVLESTGGQAAAGLVPEGLFGAPRWRPRAEIRVGLAGAGRQGRAILGELAAFEGVRVSAVCDVLEERLSSGLRRVSGAAGFASTEEMLDKTELDALIVATPTHLHVEPCLAALERGLSVYCEAPLAHTDVDCRTLARAARASNKVFQVGYQARANPIYALARSFVRSGSLRDLVALRAQHPTK
jgi:predicted dehydrogenase